MNLYKYNLGVEERNLIRKAYRVYRGICSDTKTPRSWAMQLVIAFHEIGA